MGHSQDGLTWSLWQMYCDIYIYKSVVSFRLALLLLDLIHRCQRYIFAAVG